MVRGETRRIWATSLTVSRSGRLLMSSSLVFEAITAILIPLSPEEGSRSLIDIF